MADKLILADTSILIDFFRKSEKFNSILLKLLKEGFDYSISVITQYEIYSGAKGTQVEYWQQFLKYTSVLPLDANAIDIAVNINNDLKRTSNQIDIADLFIAAIAIQNNLPIATLNKRHFERIEGLLLVNLF